MAANKTYTPGVPYPALMDGYVTVSIMGRNVLHLAVPDGSKWTLCERGGGYTREVSEEFTRRVCGECLKAATAREVQP